MTPLPQAAKERSIDFNNLSVETQNTLSQLKHLQTNKEDRMESLKVSYIDNEKDMVGFMRLNIDSLLLEYENSNVDETHEHVQYTVNDMHEIIMSLLADLENTLKEKKEELKLKQASLMSVTKSCIRLQNELLQLQKAIWNAPDGSCLFFVASIKCKEKIQQSKTYLEEHNLKHVFNVSGKSKHCVQMPIDSHVCSITAICVLPEGQVLVADFSNKKVKQLDKQYQVVSHLGVTGYPNDICQITHSAVAVTVEDLSNPPEVQFITVNRNRLVPAMKFPLQHKCICISHHQGALYISSGTALYKYSMRGDLTYKLYENISHEDTGKNPCEFIMMALEICIIIK
ncbi:hypothetical protein DPMN_062105 [Dreissena polymorpha]|uniref:Uncharacterized protein n=1 Tax=Dreissena polymorpha TaxID=45954 RepID=A0A9D4C886_DREPO|nr:hypothetical protein DPMN_062105 [Dreissena polymorpha]